MATKTCKYTTVSIPTYYKNLIPDLREAYQKEKGVGVTTGEAVGIAMQKECERLNIKVI